LGAKLGLILLGEKNILRVFENRVPTGDWRGLNNEKLHNSYSLPNTSVIRMNTSLKMRWKGV
jgi:hypothetical protein